VLDADFDEGPRFCSRCGLPIVVDGAAFCKECGARIGRAEVSRADSGQRAITAFLLSIIPGLGHLYQGYPARGVAWFFGVIIAYGAGPIGYLIHLICAVSAASYGTNRYDGRRRRRRDRRRDRGMDRVSPQF